jgi:hypothetical protein
MPLHVIDTAGLREFFQRTKLYHLPPPLFRRWLPTLNDMVNTLAKMGDDTPFVNKKSIDSISYYNFPTTNPGSVRGPVQGVPEAASAPRCG